MNQQVLTQGDGTDALGSMPSTSSPSYADRSALQTAFDHFASRVTRWAGSPGIFCVALITVVLWAAAGPIFHFSENWQLVINTGTTIVTFLMVFLIQNTQNRDAKAMQLKLDEVIVALEAAHNQMIDIESLSDEELAKLEEQFHKLRAECAVSETESPPAPRTPRDS